MKIITIFFLFTKILGFSSIDEIKKLKGTRNNTAKTGTEAARLIIQKYFIYRWLFYILLNEFFKANTLRLNLTTSRVLRILNNI